MHWVVWGFEAGICPSSTLYRALLTFMVCVTQVKVLSRADLLFMLYEPQNKKSRLELKASKTLAPSELSESYPICLSSLLD